MARKPNYDFEKRRREAERKAKQDAKREERLLRRSKTDPSDEGGAATQDAPEPTENTPE